MAAQPTKSAPILTVRALSSTGVEVPMTIPLGTSRGAITKAAFLLDRPGDRGRHHRPRLFVLLRARGRIRGRQVPGRGAARDQGRARRARRSVEQALQALRPDRRAGHRPHGDVGLRCRVLGRARASGGHAALQLSSAAKPKRIPAYNSCGLGLMPPKALADEAEKLAKGFRAVKLRLGYPTLKEDIAALHAVRKRIGDGCRHHGRLQPGALGVRDALDARTCARSGRHLLARGADPA